MIGLHLSAPTNGRRHRSLFILRSGERSGPPQRASFHSYSPTNSAIEPENRKIILYNDAPAPFPVGDIRYDYYAGGPDLRLTGGVNTPPEGSGPDTRVIMRFDVGTTGSVKELDFHGTLAALSVALPLAYLTTQPLPPFTAAPAKLKTLNEDFDNYGRLRQRLGSPQVSDYLSQPMDIAHKGETQKWRIVNLTGDTHPMHFHLVNVQILKREALA